jgi:hypothetical protein
MSKTIDREENAPPYAHPRPSQAALVRATRISERGVREAFTASTHDEPYHHLAPLKRAEINKRVREYMDR